MAQSTQPTLAGVWQVLATPIESSLEQGATESLQTLHFDGSMVEIRGPLGGDFPPAEFETAGPDFRMILRQQKLGTLLWTGQMEDGWIEGWVRWTRKDGTILTYRFSGQRVVSD